MSSRAQLAMDPDRIAERFWSKVGFADWLDCWPWLDATNSDGYGSFRVLVRGEKTRIGAHRFVCQLLDVSLPEGHEVDHLCRVPRCVNPLHLEVVPKRINVLRGIGPTAVNARKTHCPKGHEYTPENTRRRRGDGRRQCRECDNERRRVKRAAEREIRLAGSGRAPAGHTSRPVDTPGSKRNPAPLRWSADAGSPDLRRQ